MSQHCQTKLPVTSFDASTCFSEVEWILLQEWQKELYSNVMNEIHQALMSLGPLIATTVVSLKAKEKENKRRVDSERWCTANNSQDATPFGLKGDGNQSLKHRFDAERRGSNDYLSAGQYALTSVKNNKRNDAYICDLGEFETKMDITVSSSESYPSVQPEILLRIEEEEQLHSREWPVVEQSDICSRPTKGFSQLDADIGWRSLSEGKAFLVDPPRKNTEEHSTNQSAGLEVVSFTLKVEDEACSIDHRRVKESGRSDSTAGVVRPKLPRAVRREQECAVSQVSEMKGFSQLDADIGWRSQEEGKAFLVDPPCKNREEHSTSPSAGLEVVSFILKEEDEPCSVDHRRAKDRDSTAGVVRPKLPRAVRREQECAVSQVSEMKGSNRTTNSTEQLQKNTWERTRTYSEFDRSASNLSESMNNRKIHPGDNPYTEYDNSCNNESRTRKHHGIPGTQKPSALNENGRCLGESINISQQPEAHPSVKVCICCQCGICFNQSTNGNPNQQVTNSEEGNICSDCMKSFFLSANFYKDQEKEMGERPHICSECGKRFKTSQILVRHMRIHTGEKPYVCNECGKSFRHSHTLVTHQRLHTGDKPHRCATCGKDFRQIPHLMKHQRMHLRVQQLEC